MDDEVPLYEFMGVTGLESRHISRFEGEGLLEIKWIPGVGMVIQNGGEFEREVMTPSRNVWPPSLASLDAESEATFAVTGNVNFARKALEPLRYRSLEAVWTSIVNMARPSARLSHASTPQGSRSKLGGLPNAPDDFRWPSHQGAPLGFIAQIDLADVYRVCHNDILPRVGLLSFFFDALQEVSGLEPEDVGRWTVFHFAQNLRSLAKHPTALPEPSRYAEVPLQPTGELTLPDPRALEIERLQLDQRQRKAYEGLHHELEVLHAERGPIHRLLGWPESVQGDPATDVQLPASGVASEGQDSQVGPHLTKTRDIWRLLLQVESDDAGRVFWGDNGRLYFMMREADMSNHKWTKAWITLQSH